MTNVFPFSLFWFKTIKILIPSYHLNPEPLAVGKFYYFLNTNFLIKIIPAIKIPNELMVNII